MAGSTCSSQPAQIWMIRSNRPLFPAPLRRRARFGDLRHCERAKNLKELTLSGGVSSSWTTELTLCIRGKSHL